MPDVSLPPTHPDDELVTRKILREELSRELSNYPTKDDLAKALENHPTRQDLRALEESIISRIATMLEPTNDNPERIQKLERQFEGHEVRISTLEAPRRVRRKPTRRRKAKSRR